MRGIHHSFQPIRDSRDQKPPAQPNHKPWNTGQINQQATSVFKQYGLSQIKALLRLSSELHWSTRSRTPHSAWSPQGEKLVLG
ncbi:hypothetical protein DPEC_G00330640 [Dallia pectoralis]|uniref:Uncharacterized protein n=1 Tax=Dallia pectoralis TaxID=75939 RepID=A0ACC2F912_DALPE|nr:hypothetical protein DPEC_G00330640 [Dallia pectoralis]